MQKLRGCGTPWHRVVRVSLPLSTFGGVGDKGKRSSWNPACFCGGQEGPARAKPRVMVSGAHMQQAFGVCIAASLLSTKAFEASEALSSCMLPLA